MSQSHCSIQGFEEVEKETSKVKLHKTTYTIFHVSQIDPVKIQVVFSGGIDTSQNVRSTPSEQEIHETFEECRSKLKETNCCFILYNFGYYNDKNNYREMIVLISFIPEEVNLRSKIAMTSNTAVLQNSLQIPVHIEVHELEDFTFERFKSECSSIHRK